MCTRGDTRSNGGAAGKRVPPRTSPGKQRGGLENRAPTPKSRGGWGSQPGVPRSGLPLIPPRSL